MLHARILGGLGIALLVAACSSTTNNSSSSSSGSVGDGGSSGSSGSSGDGGAGGLSFKPSNIDLTGWDLSQIGDVNLSGTNCIVDDEAPDGLTALLCDTDFTNHVAHKIVTLPDQSRISIYVMKSLRIEASTILSLSRGHLPIVLVTTGSMELLGSIDVAPGLIGGAFNGGSGFGKGAGPGGGTGGDSTGLGGGGGSYCGLGGKGGQYTGGGGTAPVAPTPGYGTPELVPLLAGSAGGSGAIVSDGAGGGALQLVAGTTFTLHAGATINAGGSGGIFGGLASQPSGAGGSGGAILIESPTVKVDGAIGANGGGGGQGNGDTGESGHPDAVAKGGHKTGLTAGPDGSFGATTAGGDGASSATSSTAGGAGGAGRIRINTTTGAATITGAVSPAATTACFTQGKLGS